MIKTDKRGGGGVQNDRKSEDVVCERSLKTRSYKIFKVSKLAILIELVLKYSTTEFSRLKFKFRIY